MSDIHPMKKPWSVVGAGFNDEGVYFTFDDTVIHRDDINLMQSAPDLLEALQEMVAIVKKNTYPQPDKPSSTWGRMEAAEAVISRALGQ